MSAVTETQVLTPEQEFFVWSHIFQQKDPDDRNPSEVIAQDYKGDTSRYLNDMARGHDIKFCDGCEKAEQECKC